MWNGYLLRGAVGADFCIARPADNKQIINVGEGNGTNYHFRGDLDVAIFPKLLAEER